MRQLSIVFAILFAVMCGIAYAHSGGTDSEGCHIDHRTGVRHCH